MICKICFIVGTPCLAQKHKNASQVATGLVILPSVCLCLVGHHPKLTMPYLTLDTSFSGTLLSISAMMATLLVTIRNCSVMPKVFGHLQMALAFLTALPTSASVPQIYLMPFWTP